VYFAYILSYTVFGEIPPALYLRQAEGDPSVISVFQYAFYINLLHYRALTYKSLLIVIKRNIRKYILFLFLNYLQKISLYYMRITIL